MPEPDLVASGTLYLIPVGLAEGGWQGFLPPATREIAGKLCDFIVENAKTARAELKRIGTSRPIQEIDIREIPRSPTEADLEALLAPLCQGRDVGLMSEAGCPAVADPGALVVRRAHQRSIRVVPLVGPSSLLLALMASGLNGQSFAFHGYLPVQDAERLRCIKQLEAESRRERRTQLFIETPYRNGRLYDSLLSNCQPSTLLCVATDLTSPREQVTTHSVGTWRKLPRPELDRRPTVFLLLAE